MPVSRRLRFEILRRDNHTCRYCGASAPDVALTVDHVIPVTLGGGDEPNNLVTACRDCNAGKSSIAPDSQIVEDVDAAALLFGGALTRAIEIRRAEFADMQTRVVQWAAAWNEWTWGADNNAFDVDPGWQLSIERFYENGLDLEDLVRFIETAMDSSAKIDGKWAYFCGCCWREITRRQELARQLIEDGEV